MKRSTHVIFSAGLASYVSKIVGLPLHDIALIAMFAGVMQYIIDAVSHETIYAGNRKIVRRTPLFHSPSGALVIAVAFSVLISYILKPGPAAIAAIFVVMLISSFSHLALDLLTEKGIYVHGRRVRRKRWASTRNPLLNFLFSALGLLLLVEAFLPR
jgi:membrane-bound metal-dependent hydrolase YbcI (DUF457 family)